MKFENSSRVQNKYRRILLSIKNDDESKNLKIPRRALKRFNDFKMSSEEFY